MLAKSFVFFAACVVFWTICASGSRESDLSLHLYSADGQVEQLTFATRAIDNCPPRVSFRDDSTGIVASFAVSKLLSSLHDGLKPTIEVDHEVGVAYIPAGYGPDLSYLLKHVNKVVQVHCLTYGEAPNVDYVAFHVSNWITRGMYKQDGQDSLSRPLAAAASITAYDRVLQRNRLVLVDNTGLVCEKSISLLGKFSPTDRDTITNALTVTVLPDALVSADARVNNWLQKCHTCLNTLLKDDDAGDTSLVVDCCLLDAQGAVHRTPGPLRTVKETVAWIQQTVHAENFKVQDT